MLDVLVIGAGHAGIEAAAAATRLGARTALVTLDLEGIGRLSCNPAIGGIGKGHLVREIHVLGGLMGRLADGTGIQFRLLNVSRGPAVRGPRAQVDRARYPRAATQAIRGLPLDVIEGEVTGLLVAEHHCRGVRLREGGDIRARCVVLASGTFLGGRLHVGRCESEGGRQGERAATALATQLRQLGIPLGRFKTGTPPRLHRDSIDWGRLQLQEGDVEPTFFCPETLQPALPQVTCHLAYTTPEVHAAVRRSLDESPLMDGRITGSGPRYCPSFEEKVVRFADRERHLLILEPEGLDSDRIYVNGASTSLPVESQEHFLRRVPGLEKACFLQHGYAVEYDHVLPGEVGINLELRRFAGLFVAGQALGTTGYEEAAALGLVAGANAALRARGAPPWVLGRHEAYVGVLVDDLVTRGIDEPYRMFTSRAEHRLSLGIDSADLRLATRAAALGLASTTAARAAQERGTRLDVAEALLMELPAEGGRTLGDTCRRPELDLATLLERVPEGLRPRLGDDARSQRRTLVEAAQRLRYASYRERQARAAARWSRRERVAIPPGFSFLGLPGLSREVQERLERARPVTLGQAARLPGIPPASLQVLDAHVSRHGQQAVPRGTKR